MRRRYGTELFAKKIQHIKSVMPDAFIGVDVIVGTRGETEELFAESLAFAQKMDVSQYHVFSYSERPGTMALKIPHSVSVEEKRTRSNQMLEVSAQKLRSFYSRYIGTIRPVLLEHTRRKDVMNGFTDNYIKVELPASAGMDNTIVPVRLLGFNVDGSALLGEVVK